MLERYQPSGLFGAMALPAAAAAAVAGFAAAWLYELAVHWIPLIYILFFVTIGFAFGLAMLATLVVQLGHVRNRALALLLGVMIGLAGTAGGHLFGFWRACDMFVDGMVEAGEIAEGDASAAYWATAFNPDALKSYIDSRVETGWSIGRVGSDGSSFSGILVWLIWLIEAGILVAWPAWQGYDSAGAPYCEQTGAWADAETLIGAIPAMDELATTYRDAQSFEQTLPPQTPPTEGAFLLIWKLNRTEQGDGQAFLTISKVWTTVDDDGNETNHDESLVRWAEIEDGQVTRLEQAMEQTQAALEAASQAPADTADAADA